MAANVVYVYIYSNDGAQVLHEYLTGANSLTVTDKGCLYNDSVEWTYEGTNTFLGFATSANATEPTYAIGDSVTLTLGGSDAFYVVERKSESSGVTVEYSGSVITTIPNGNTATLPVKDLKMKTDIVITVPEAEGGTDSAIPIEVATEAEMTALLESGEVGGVYKYTGTTGTYENGALYVLEEGASLIIFTVAGTSYQAEEGMTWAEFIDSEYNPDTNYDTSISNIEKRFELFNGGVHYASDEYNHRPLITEDGSTGNVYSTDVVQPIEYDYYVAPGGSN